MRSCPRCSRYNADDALTCECGYDLASDRAKARPGLRRTGGSLAVAGAALVAFGALGGMSLLPVRISVFLSIAGHPIDLGLVAAGVVLLLVGLRRLDRADDAAGARRSGRSPGSR